MNAHGLFLPSPSRAPQYQPPPGHMATTRGSSDEEEEDSQEESEEDSVTAIKKGIREDDRKDVRFTDNAVHYKAPQPQWTQNERGETDL